MKTTARLLLVFASLACAGAVQAQTLRHTWTSSLDFEGGQLSNVNAQTVSDQLQLDLSQIETPYLWVSNTGSNTVARIDSATGRVLSVSSLPSGFNPSRTAVDLDFNCWVASRSDNGRALHLSAQDGRQLGASPYVGSWSRGVALNARGEVWISSSLDDGQGIGWMKLDTHDYQPLTTFRSPLGSYGLTINAFGDIFTTTSWLGGETYFQRLDAETGRVEQNWDHGALAPNGVYGIAADLNGDLWGAVRFEPSVLWVQGDYQCPDGAQTCDISLGHGLRRKIDVNDVLVAAGSGTGRRSGRGLAVDANGFIWVVFNDRTDGGQPSYAVKIDGLTGEPILAVPTGTNSVGITPDANGFIWVVNNGGGGSQEHFVDLPCPEGGDNRGNGTVTKLRSSDGSIVATYRTCGNNPYTYSDMAGYTLRSVTLRSGTWRASYDSQQDGLQWGRIDWNERSYDDTRFEVQVRAADSTEALEQAAWTTVSNGGGLPMQGRYIQVEAFFFTRNDFLGPELLDLTVSSVCIPEAEQCDGFDNDCDGVVDNGNPGGGQACSTGLEGVCDQGQRVCVGGDYLCRPLLEPQAEVCDEADNNCNGLIDEGVLNRCGGCGPEPTEVCDGEDNDCDGLTDEEVQNACGGCGPAPAEICDGEDNDCDGLTDEGVSNACGGCGPVPEEICDGEDNDCDGLIDEGVANACGGCGPEPTEICNGVDDDCDGAIDEGLINACGECGPAPTEICNGVDDDCDGRVDEEVRNACGFCGELPQEICDGVDNNCDGQVDEGLTNACGGCGPVPTEICNGVDDDCDGEVDEGVQNACGACGLEPTEVCDGVDNDCDGQVDEGVQNACGGCGPLEADLCDGVDNDCDGDVDEEAACPGSQACVEGQCAERCAAGECVQGYLCREGFCLEDRCLGRSCPGELICLDGTCLDPDDVPCQGVACEGEQICLGGQCQEDPCPQMECEVGQSCWQGRCRPDEVVACLELDCGTGQICQDGRCQEDPCAQVRCEQGQACQEGVCVDACLEKVCATGFVCRSGECVEDACFQVTCPEGQLCEQGNCIHEACVGVTCPQGEACGAEGCAPIGACGDAVCQEGEVCQAGACISVGEPGGEDPGQPAPAPEEGCGCATPAAPAPQAWPWLWAALGAGVLALGRRR